MKVRLTIRWTFEKAEMDAGKKKRQFIIMIYYGVL